LLHELVHVATGITAEKGGDWIVEGIAEYYSLKLMWRSGTLTNNRYRQSFRKYEKWALDADRLDVEVARGPVTARAVGIMRKLDREILRKTGREKSLDDVVRMLVETRQKVSTERFRHAAAAVMGAPAESLSDDQLGFNTAVSN
jgi:predicted metalloprotease with PDZ domain